MTNQSIEIAILEEVKSFYAIGLTHDKANEDQLALTYYTQSLNRINSVYDNGREVDEMRYDNYFHVSKIYIRQHSTDLAGQFIKKALETARKLQNNIKIAECLDCQADIRSLEGDDDGALHDYMKSIAIKLNLDGIEGLDIVISYLKVGNIYFQRSNYNDALVMYEKSLKIQLSTIDYNHPTIATIYHNIGIIYSSQGSYDKALLMFKKSLKMSLIAPDDNQPDVARTYNSMGVAYHKQGKYDDAVSMFKKSLQIQLAISGDSDNDPHIANVYNNIASAYAHQGKYDDSLHMYKISLKINLSVLGDYHPHTSIASTYHNIGNVYSHQGKFHDALWMYKKSLEMSLLIIDGNDSKIIHINRDINDTNGDQSQFDNVIYAPEKSIDIHLLSLGDCHSSIAKTYGSVRDTHYVHNIAHSMNSHRESPHVQLSAPCDHPFLIAATYQNIGIIYNLQGKYDDAVSMLNKSLNIDLSRLGDHHPRVADTYNHMGNICRDQGKYDDALSMYKKSLQIQLSALGEHHPSIANTYHNMGDVYNNQGKYGDAIDVYEKSLKIQLSTFGDNHPRIAVTYHNIGTVYKDQGWYDDALLMYKKSLNIFLSVHGDNNIHVANVYYNIASIYVHQGKDDEALSMYNKSLRMCSLVYDHNHYRIAQIYNSIGSIYSNQGKYDDALSMHNKSLDIQLSALDTNHPDIAITYFNIGNIYNQQGKYDHAIATYRKSLKIQLFAFGDNHPCIANTYHNIGSAYNDQGNYDDALSMYNKSLKIKLSLLGHHHPSIADTYNNMGIIYCGYGKYDDALSMHHKSLQILLPTLGDHHTNVSITYINIGRVYTLQGKFDDALIMFEKSLKIDLSIYDENHPSIAQTYARIATAYGEQGKYDQALSVFKKSLTIQLSVLDHHHPSIGNTYRDIGSIYHKQGQYNDALSMYKKSFEIEVIAFGDSHINIAATYYNIGNVLQDQGKYPDALSMYQKAADILIRYHGENHPHIADTYDNMADCYDQQNQHDEATAMRQRVNEINNNLQQADIIHQQPTNPSNQSQGDPHKPLEEDKPTLDLSDQQVQSEQVSNFDKDQNNSDQEDDYNRALKEKQYFNAYMNALQYGSCKNKVIRAMYTGPQYVGKSSIMKVFTKQKLFKVQSPTQIVDESDRMVYVKVYKIQDRTMYDLDKVWNNSIHTIVQTQIDHHVDKQQTVTLTHQIIKLQHLSIDDQYHNPTNLQSTSIREERNNNTTTTLTSSNTLVAPPSNSRNLYLQQCRDFFQYYYPSWLNKTADDSQYAKIWDFGGQSIYHVTHQPFLSSNSIYILVFNINQNIHDKVLTRDNQSLHTTYLQAMQEWLTSIIGGNSSQSKITADIDHDQVTYSLPIVILVASHGDCISGEEEGTKRFIQFERELRSHLPSYNSNIYSSRIIFNCNPDDNSHATLAQREECSLRLHQIMKSFVQSLPFMRHPIPIRWYIMATILHTPMTNNHYESVASMMNQIRATRVHNIMTLQQIITLAQDFGLYDSNDQLIAMLNYLHDLGEIIFCRRAGQHGIIVTNVDWLLQLFRAIIQLQDCPSGSLEIQSLYQTASQTGRISRKYIDYVLLSYNVDEKTKTNILNLMETYDIICTITNDNDQDEIQYFVPYLLRTDIKPFDLSRYHVSQVLYIGYNHSDIPYIPDGIYYCLLSSCLKEWNNTDIELYYQCAKYYLRQECHYIMVKKEKSYIALQYCYKKESKSQVAKLLRDKVIHSIYHKGPHQLIQSKLASIVDDRMPKFKGATCQFYVRCCDCNQLVNLCSKIQSPENNMLQCLSCYAIFESQSINDWMVYKEECWHVRESQESAKQQVCNDTKDRDPQQYFYQIANSIGNDWTKLAAALESHIDVDVIRNEDHDSIFNQAIKFLKMWYKKNCPYATIDRLHKVLKQIGRNDIVMAIHDSSDKSAGSKHF